MNFKSKKIYIETITPLLIVQESAIAGLTYYIDNNRKVTKVNFEKFIDSLNWEKDRQIINIIAEDITKLTQRNTINTGDIKLILSRTNRVSDIEKFAEYSLENHSKQHFRLMGEVKFNAKICNKPYIPGSSIKGAVQTALISYKKSIEETQKPEEGNLFGFRDSILGNTDSLFFSNLAIFNLSIKNKIFKEQQRATGYCEAIKPGQKFETEILFKNENFINTMKQAILFKNLFVIENELKFFKNIQQNNATPDTKIINEIVKTYENIKKELEKEEIILRLGMGSGFQSVSSIFSEKILGKEQILDKELPHKSPAGKQIERAKLPLESKIKSRKFVYYKGNYTPLGWVKMTI
ncbi:MAG: type III-A CRISPR-associated RAMP protein Csm5 [Candidatus Diapherotrites archaeon]